MRIYENRVYTTKNIENESNNTEHIYKENIILVIPKGNYCIEYDITNQQRVTNNLKISWEGADDFYLIVPTVKNDAVLKKYNIHSNYAYYILYFENGELIDFGGIEEITHETYYFQKDDFKRDNKQKMRVLQAPIVALYAPGLYVKGLRELGYKTEYMVNNIGNDICFTEEMPDFNLELEGNTTEVCRARIIEFMIYALKNYDIMHFHSNWSLLLGADRLWECNSDIGYLKRMGKKITMSYWGLCDHTIKDEYKKFEWFSECDVCVRCRPVLCENKRYNDVIRRTRKYTNKMFTVGRGVIADGNTVWVENPIDIDSYSPVLLENVPKKFKLPNTDRIRIYHSVANMKKRDDVKGTQYVKKAVEKLQEEGYAVELILFSDVNHTDLKYYQVQADIVVDQLYAGWYGSTGVECLALGKPVITYVNPDVEQYVKLELKRDIPVVSAKPETIYEVLKDLVSNREKRIALGRNAREYAEKYHDYRVVAKRLDEIYRSV